MSDDLVFGVQLKSTGDDSVPAVFRSAREEAEKLKQATDELAAASAKAASQQAVNAEELQQYWTGMSIAEDNAKAKAWALANGYQESGGVMIKAVEDVAGAHKTNAVAIRESMVMMREAAVGNWSRMTASSSILANSLNLMPLLFNPITLGIVGISAAVGASIYVWEEYGDKSEEAARQAAGAFDDANKKISDDIEKQIALLKERIYLNDLGVTAKTSDAEADSLAKLAENIDKERQKYMLYAATHKMSDEEAIFRQQVLNTLVGEYDQMLGKINERQKLSDQNNPSTKNNGAKQLADIQRFDASMLEIDKDAFTKRIDQWVEYEDVLLANIKAGDASAIAQESKHQAALNVMTQAEYDRITAQNKKEADAKADHMASVLGSEANYFARLQAMADDAALTAGGRAKLGYDRELIALNAEHGKTAALIKGDHDKGLAEEAAYQTALANLKKAYALQNFQEDATVHAMGLAFTEQNHEAELESTLGFFEKLSSFGASHHRAMFELNKISSMAITAINTAKGVSGVLAEFPGPVGWGMAGAQLALGVAQEVAISETQFGGGGISAGGGGIPSFATSPGAPVAIQPPSPTPQAVAAQSPQQLNITVIGAKENPDKAVLSFNALVDIVNGINKVGQNGYKINAAVIAS